MDIRFRTRQLQRTCNSRTDLQRRYGGLAGVIELRLQVLAMANHLGQVPPMKPVRRHQLSRKWPGQFAVDLLHPYRLVFRPDHTPVPLKPDGAIAVNAVNAIEIIGIIDDH